MAEARIDQIAAQWRERSSELGDWAFRYWVNRKDIWGRYLAEKYRGETNTGQPKNKAITAPFARERGKIALSVTSLIKHFKARDASGILGVHSQAQNGTCRWLAIDIDYHNDDDYTGSRESNYLAATTWLQRLQSMGFDPLLMDSNGDGGYHLMVFFQSPMNADSVRRFMTKLIADYQVLGLDNPPDLFPGSHGSNHFGSWLRLPGRHHTRAHFTRVFNDEPFADSVWLEGHDAIDRMLSIQMADEQLLKKQNITPKKLTICLDFDGVVHSYLSGWKGIGIVADPPIHKVDIAIRKLRQDFRVVVHSARCNTEEGRVAIQNWLNKHHIEVDDVCEHKPPAHVYVDDRAVHFQGDWDKTIADIKAFRK
jgi:hypothetical protein